MKIAVLMSTYNGEKYLNEQLESLYNQTIAESISIYIRDDGSDDCSIDIIKKWQKKMDITLFIGKKTGPANSFWNLFSNVEIDADYFLFCDQDDIWDSNKVETQIAALNSKTCLSICNCRLINNKGMVINNLRIKKEPEISIENIFVAGIGQGCAMAFTKELRNYIISCAPKCIPMHDVIVSLYAVTYGRIAWIQQALFSYRVHENNVVAKNRKTFLKRIKTTYKNCKNGSINSMSYVAMELLNNQEPLALDVTEYLKKVSGYRHSLSNKFDTMYNKNIRVDDKKALHSYRIRLMLNLY